MATRELFEETRINSLTLKNRFVRSATWTGLAHADGMCSPGLIDRMVALAQGGVGLMVTGHAYVLKNGQAGPWQIGINRDELIAGLLKLTDRVHEHGGKIIIQLAHAGIYADPKLTGQTPVAVSSGVGFVPYPVREMTSEDIEEVAKAFEVGAQRAKAAGFDGIQLHAAHGYLLSQFLSPAYNKRRDRHGGSVENRSFVVVRIIQQIRKTLGLDYPILIKMNSLDLMDSGIELEDSMKAATMFEKAGIDAIEVSGGTRESAKPISNNAAILSKTDEAYYEAPSCEFRKHLAAPLILVGGIRSLAAAQRLVDNHAADYIAMSRPFIREPGLIKRWQSGDLKSSTCVSDSRCLAPGLRGEGIRCHMAC